ncbi:NUDIX hydrolase [Candidatus Woesearchaeota archaeon]|nr:NUDIX hydrolase [Candidatus Woesearchaeota archaeon]
MTMPAKKIDISSAKTDKLFYVVANVVIFRERDQKCLVLKRSMREKVHPGRYCVPGGKLEWKDLPIDKPTRINGEVLDYADATEKLLVKEVKEEAGITIDLSRGLKYLNSVAFIRPDGIPVMLIKFAAYYRSGEVVLEEGSFTDYAWVDAKEVKKLPTILGIAEEVEMTIKILRKNI